MGASNDLNLFPLRLAWRAAPSLASTTAREPSSLGSKIRSG